ncbi:MAG TPA: acyltransferase family protein [Vicinamibacteria bacterium]|nr:acyltransferase family protein [Vicinamibacteria bacterium]
MPPRPGPPGGIERRRRPRNREIYIDVFRGLMALVMVQGHVFDHLVRAADRAQPLYQFQALFHGSTAPGFLFASGFVAGLPRAPLSLAASVRRARRLVFVLGAGYFLHVPYFSLWKTANASPAEKAALFACDALQVIAVTQLAVLALQWMVGRRWVKVAALGALAILAAGPRVWESGLARRLPTFLGAYVDTSVAPSHFPVFPFAAFVLAGTAAGAWLGRTDRATRRRRATRAGTALVAAGLLLAAVLAGDVPFWTVSPAYALIRLGALALLLPLVERTADVAGRIVPWVARLGHETLLVYVLHLVVLFGGVLFHSPLGVLQGRIGFGAAFLVFAVLLPVLYAAASAWHLLKMRRPHAAWLALSFVTVLLCWEFVTRPW